MGLVVGVNEYELIEGPEIHLSREGWSGSETYKVPWADALTVAEYVWNSYAIVGGNNYFLYLPGASSSLFSFLVTDTIDITAFDSNTPQGCSEPASAQWSKFKINYKTSTTDESNNNNNGDELTKFEHKIRVGGEFLTIPSKDCKWNNGDKVESEDTPIGRLIPTAEHDLHFPSVVNPPMAAIREVMGCVNNRLFMGSKSETLLFTGAELSRTVTAARAKAWDLTYRFSERLAKVGPVRLTWNHFYRPDAGAWQILLLKDGSRVYSQDDFTGLFQVT